MGFNWRHIVLLVAVVLAAVWMSLPADRERGLQLYRSGRIVEAAKILTVEQTQHSGDRTIAQALVDIHLQSGNPALAAAALAVCVAKHPEDMNLVFQLADLHRQAGHLDQAIACLRNQPQSPELLKRRAALAEECDDLTQAIADLEAQRTGAPTDAPLLERLVVLQGWRGDVRAKAENQERLARLTRDPAQVETWLGTAVWLHDKDMRRRACVVAESLPDPGAKLLRMVVDQYQVAGDVPSVLRAGVRLVALHGTEPSDWLELADAQQWNGQFELAITTLNKAAQLFPGRIDIETALMEQCYDRGHLDQAYEHAARLTELADSPSHRRQAAQLANDCGRFALARRWLVPLVAADPMDVDAVEFDARLAWQHGDQLTARAHLERLSIAAQQDGGKLSLLRRSATLAAEFSDTPRQQTLLELLVRLQPSDHQSLLTLARLYAENGRIESARRLVEQASGLPGVDHLELITTIARIELVATSRLTPGDPTWVAQRTRTITALQQVLSEHGDTDMRVELIRLYLDGEDVALAKEELAKLGDPPMDVLVTLAQVLASHHDPVGARALLERIPALDALPHGVLAGVALARLQLGEATLAISAFERALVIAPETDAYVVGLSDACLAAGQTERGFALLHARALRAQPGADEQAWLDLAARYRWHGDPLGEAAVLDTAQRRLGARAAFLARAIEVAVLRDRSVEAVAAWSRLLSIRPPAKECDQPSVLRAAASALNATGDRAGAAQLYARLLKAHGDDQESMLALARIAAIDGRTAEAEMRFRRYLRLKPDDPWAWYDLGEMLAAHGLDGRKELAEALRRLPRDERADYLAVRAACQHRLGYNDEAIRLYQRAIERGASGAIIGDFAVLLIELDRQVQAAQVLALGCARAPTDRRLKQLVAALQIADGRSREALALLRSMGAERSDDRSLLGDLGTAAEGSGAWTEAMRAYGAAAGDAR